MPKIAIIGAGISGLCTGYMLHRRLLECSPQNDCSISLFESSDRIGGVIQTEMVDGFLIDHGADMFATNPSAAMDLCEQLGVADQLILPQESRRGARIYTNGELIPIPEGFVLMRATRTWPMLTTPLLSWSAKLRFLVERFCRVGAHDDGFDESVAEFVTRRMGRSVLEKIVAPLAAGIYTADVTQLSMRSTMKPIHQMEKTHRSLYAATKARARSGEDAVDRTSTGARYGQFRTFPGGMGQLVESIANALPRGSLRLNHEVTSIDRPSIKWRLTVNQTQHDFDHVVLAAPANAASRLLRPVNAEVAETLGSIRSASTAIVVLGVNRTQIRKDIETFGFVVPPCEGKQVLAGSFASHKFAGRAPNDSVLIRCFVGGMLHPDTLQRTDEELVASVREELGEMIGLQGEPRLIKVIRWPSSMPQYEVGHHRKVNTIKHEIAELHGLWLNNNALHGVGIAPLVNQAKQTADSIAKTILEQCGT